MDVISVTGIAASVGTGISLLPQLIKLLKKKEAGDLSLWMLISLFIGLGLWVCYGILKNDWIIIISNGFSFIINVLVGVLTLKYKKSS